MRLTIRSKKIEMSLRIQLVSYKEYADLNKNVLSDDLNDDSVFFDFIWSGS